MENTSYVPAESRYSKMSYAKCGASSVLLSKITLGLWHNFGGIDSFSTASEMLRTAFDSGITHFDLANNYGPPPGSAEENFGKIFRENFASHRDELFISSKAGHLMWSGPYGDGSSRKNLMASIDQSLRRTGLEYFDIFYSHRYDGNTPLEETAGALIDIVKRGKALYAGLSKYPPLLAQRMYKILRENGVPALLYQDRYSLFNRGEIEQERIPLAAQNGAGFVAFSPLAQGLLTDKYLHGIPENSRAAKPSGFLRREEVTPEKIELVSKLNDIARSRGQSLAQMAIAWVLHNPNVTSAIIGASSVEQLKNNLAALENPNFSAEELLQIDASVPAN